MTQQNGLIVSEAEFFTNLFTYITDIHNTA